MRNTRLLTSLTMSLGLLAGTACAASADVSGAALGVPETQQVPEQVSLQPEAGGELVTGKGGGNPGGGGGGGGPVASGVVFFLGGNSNIWYMNADGPPATSYTGATEVVHDGDGIPTRELHDGLRYLLSGELDPAGGTYPNGRPHVRLIADAVNGSGIIVDSIVLISPPDMEFQDGHHQWVIDPNSGQDDGLVAWNARRWDLSATPPTVIEAGIYSARLTYDTSTGAMMGIDPSTIALALPFSMAPITTGGPDECYRVGGDWFANVTGWSWQPGSARIVYTTCDSSALYTAEANGTLGTHLSLGVQGINPDWSVDRDSSTSGDQSLIAFQADIASHDFIDIVTVDPNAPNPASTMFTVVPGNTSRRKFARHQSPKWSPTGSHIAYGLDDGTLSVDDLMLTLPDGTGKTLLADFGERATGWVR